MLCPPEHFPLLMPADCGSLWTLPAGFLFVCTTCEVDETSEGVFTVISTYNIFWSGY